MFAETAQSERSALTTITGLGKLRGASFRRYFVESGL